MLASTLSIVVNVALFALKFALGLIAGSVAIVADAVHTLTDCGTSVVVLIGFKISSKPSDAEHPFGHGRMEAVSALVVSVLLFLAGAELLKEAVARLFKPDTLTPVKAWVLVALGLTLVAKEAMARFTFALGKRIDSDSLRADAIHHRSDAISTVLVIAALVFERFGIRHADAVGGLLVSLFVIHAAYTIARGTIDSLLGKAPTPELLQSIEATARAHDAVEGVHDIIVHEYGNKRLISLHIETSNHLSPNELHDLSDRVERSIAAHQRAYVVTHVDPIDRSHPLYDDVARALTEITAQDARLHSFHDLRLAAQDSGRTKAVFDIALADRTTERESRVIREDLAARFRGRFPNVTPVIKVDPKYTYTA